MDLFNQVNAVFTVIGSILAFIVIFYVKDIVKDIKQVRYIPELLEKVNSLISKIESLMLNNARLEEQVKSLERRLEVLESNDKLQ